MCAHCARPASIIRCSFRARFRSYYRVVDLAESGLNSNPTKEDLHEFARVSPEAAHQLQVLRTQGRISQTAGAIGTVATVAGTYKVSKTPALLVLGAMLGGLATTFLVQDFSSWALGTYTFDNLTPIEQYNEWKNAKQTS